MLENISEISTKLNEKYDKLDLYIKELEKTLRNISPNCHLDKNNT